LPLRILLRHRGDGNFGQEAVAAAGDGFDEAWVVSRVAESLANLVDGFIEAVIEVDERIGGPEAPLQFLPGDDLAAVLEEHGENLKGLLLEANA